MTPTTNPPTPANSGAPEEMTNELLAGILEREARYCPSVHLNKAALLSAARRLRLAPIGATPASDGAAPYGQLYREQLGKEVRRIWIEWAKEQPITKPHWLSGWEELKEPDREVDRRIGQRLFAMGQQAFATTSDAVAEPKKIPCAPFYTNGAEGAEWENGYKAGWKDRHLAQQPPIVATDATEREKVIQKAKTDLTIASRWQTEMEPFRSEVMLVLADLNAALKNPREAQRAQGEETLAGKGNEFCRMEPSDTSGSLRRGKNIGGSTDGPAFTLDESTSIREALEFITEALKMVDTMKPHPGQNLAYLIEAAKNKIETVLSAKPTALPPKDAGADAEGRLAETIAHAVLDELRLLGVEYRHPVHGKSPVISMGHLIKAIRAALNATKGPTP